MSAESDTIIIPSPDVNNTEPRPPKQGRLQRLKHNLALMASIELDLLNPPELPPEHRSVENSSPDEK